MEKDLSHYRKSYERNPLLRDNLPENPMELFQLWFHEADDTGNQRWELDRGANLYDVTHLGCRSARYTPLDGQGSCTPANAPQDAFRVQPGAAMPPVEGCAKQDYLVLFIVALPADKVAAN